MPARSFEPPRRRIDNARAAGAADFRRSRSDRRGWATALLAVALGSLLSTILTACETFPTTRDTAESPTAFHNTRLSYALLTNDVETLQRDFQMKTQPTWVTRVVAGFLLLPSGGMETVTWPVFVGLREHLDATRQPSVPAYLPGTPGLPPPRP